MWNIEKGDTSSDIVSYSEALTRNTITNLSILFQMQWKFKINAEIAVCNTYVILVNYQYNTKQ